MGKTQRKQGASNSKTQKIRNQDGWIKVHVRGTPYEMGYQHGRILRKQIEKLPEIMKYMVEKDYKTSVSEYVSQCKSIVDKYTDLPEWKGIFDELKGIRDGCRLKSITLNFLIAWNMYLSMNEIYEAKNTDQRCSAFIATGSKTHDGNIIMAHNTHCDYVVGFISNIVLHMHPTMPGSIPFVMQTLPGLVCSSTDWFISESGIIGCESTISEINYKPDFETGVPYFFRIRKAMETGKTLDDYVAIMLEKNAGDYACSWFFGDVNTGEILRLELAKKTHGIERTKDGMYYGMNSAITPEVSMIETNDTNLDDPTSRTGSRNFRLEQLLNAQKIDLKYAKKVLADHYDYGENRFRKGMRGICRHSECEKGENHKLAGAVDGKVVDAKMAKEMKFIGRMGSSCGRVFKKKDYTDAPKCLIDMPKYGWVSIGESSLQN
jgi:hypothetical protein